jgi:hypothetical protein
MDEERYRYLRSRFKVVFAVAVTVTLTVPPVPIVAVQMLHLYNLFPAVPVMVKWHRKRRTMGPIRTKCCCNW